MMIILFLFRMTLALLINLKQAATLLHECSFISRRYFQRRWKTYQTDLASFEGYQQPDTKHDAFNQALTAGNKLPCIILVNPYLDQNVGSVARTMMNFGLTELRIVDPICDVYSDNAKALSAGAFEIIQNAKIHKNLSDCISDLTYVFATSNRPRHMTQMVYTPNKAAEIAINSTYQDEKVGILFGRERYGLYNSEMAMATGMISIPTFNHFSSLNLAQSVNIIAYELWNRNDQIRKSSPPDKWLQPKDKDRLARRNELEYYFLRLETLLNEKNFTIDDKRRVYVYQAIRNIYQRTLMTKTEVDLLQGVLTALTRENRKQNDKQISPTNDN